MTTDPRDAEQAREALHKAEKEHCSNFDKGAVFHWAERGAYMLKADAQAEIARLTADLDWLKRSIFGSADYHPSLTIGCFAEMAQTTEAARKGGLDRAEKAEAERDAALAQVATAITGNKSGTICRDCRGVGMIHCSDPFNCGGMQPYTVEELKSALSRRDAQMRAEGRKEGLWEAAEIADAKDPDKPTNYLHRRENIPAAILAAAEKGASP